MIKPPWAEHCARHSDAFLAQHTRPRAEWGEGPWQDEPDLVRWTTTAGLPGFIWRSPVTGALCGYAAVALGHPYFAKSWKQLEMPVDVHGGLTFCGSFDPPTMDAAGHALEDDWIGKWWIGFDCSHAFDRSPGLLALMRDLRNPRHWAAYAAAGHEPPSGALSSLFEGDRYWTVDAARGEVESLAAQLVAAANPGVAELLDGIRADEKLTP